MANIKKILDRKIDVESIIAELMISIGNHKMFGDQIRFESCPICNSQHPKNPAFVINVKEGTYYCHDCYCGGHVSSLTNKGSTPVITEESKSKDDVYNQEARDHYNELNTAADKSLTSRYLLKRGIYYNTWSDLDLPLKEINNEVAVYPFIDEQNRIVAVQRLFINSNTLEKDIGRRYKGEKSKGVAILKDASVVIVAEGLETGLSVRQHLGNDYGLIICGDASNLSSLADKNSWAISQREEIIIASDNDVNNVGIKAARAVFIRFHKKTKIYTPSRPNQDWNDVLLFEKMREEWI